MMKNCLVWNVCGLDTSHKCLRKLLKKYQVGLTTIMEQFQKEESINMFVQSLEFTNWCTNENWCGKTWVVG